MSRPSVPDVEFCGVRKAGGQQESGNERILVCKEDASEMSALLEAEPSSPCEGLEAEMSPWRLTLDCVTLYSSYLLTSLGVRSRPGRLQNQVAPSQFVRV